ncbi:hypothetical protein ECTW11039_5711 [Escherichia coli TW11039]|nr:hypothetical protein ECTW11039_5711 [Escherichia coli TW11039]
MNKIFIINYLVILAPYEEPVLKKKVALYNKKGVVSASRNVPALWC